MARPTLRQILGENIKIRLKKLGLTQEKVSELAGVSNGHFSDLVNARSWPSDRVLERLAEALQMEPYELFIPPESKEGEKLERMLEVEILLREKIAELVRWGLKTYRGDDSGPPKT